jgi:hypothetical protein
MNRLHATQIRHEDSNSTFGARYERHLAASGQMPGSELVRWMAVSQGRARSRGNRRNDAASPMTCQACPPKLFPPATGMAPRGNADSARLSAIIDAVLTLQEHNPAGEQDTATGTRRFTSSIGAVAEPIALPAKDAHRQAPARGRRRAERQGNTWLNTLFQKSS